MNEKHTLHPLTARQREFAAANHQLILDYLKHRGLEQSEYYDIVVLRYLSAVQRYDENPALHRYGFKTIAFAAMRSALNNHWEEKRRRNESEVSLYEKGSDHMTREETVGMPDPGYMAVEQRDEIERLSRYITRRDGNVLHLKLRGFNTREIAGKLGCHSSTINRCLGKMRLRIVSGPLAA